MMAHANPSNDDDTHMDTAIRIRQSLEAAISSTSTSTSSLMAILNEARDLKVSAELLKRTKIGIVTNKLKSHPNAQVSELASLLVDRWKTQVLQGPTKKRHATEAPVSPPKKHRSSPVDAPKATNDPTRDKCIHMLCSALQAGLEERKQSQSAPFSLLETDHAASLAIAIAIESLLYKEFATTNAAYKAKFRSKYLNLREETNPALRRSLLDGTLLPAAFVAMTTAQMASEERRSADAAIQRDNLLKARAAKDCAPETDMFQCGRCKQRKCKYFQMQTRSADEPMTTYVTCMHCGHRWKASPVHPSQAGPA